MLLLLDYWPLERWKQKRLRYLLVEKVPFFLLAAITSAITYVAQRNAGMMKEFADLPYGARLENALVSYGRYLGKLFWPADLCALYPHPGRWPIGLVLFSGLVILGISILAWVQRRQRPYLLTGWFWYLGTLVPVIGLVQVGSQSIADRYTYIPSVGILMILVWEACRLTKGWRGQNIILGATGGAVALVCIGLTRQQIGYWKDGVSVWSRAVAVTENNYAAHNNLGRAFYRKDAWMRRFVRFRKLIRLNPGFAEAVLQSGSVLMSQRGEADKAMACYQKALEVQPDYVAAHNSLGSLLLQKGQVDQAMVHCQKALELEPGNVTALSNLGFAYSLMGRLDEAAAQLQKVVEIQPDNETAQNNLGSVLLRMGRVDGAIGHFRSALKLQPDSAETHNNLASALLAQRQMDEAIHEFREAARLQPDAPEIRRNLGYALGKQGRLDEAIQAFQEALKLKPDYAEASNDLVIALA